jgi:hypothetical protein
MAAGTGIAGSIAWPIKPAATAAAWQLAPTIAPPTAGFAAGMD